MSNVTQKTQEIIAVLRELSTTSKTAAANIAYLENIVNKVGQINLAGFADAQAQIEKFGRALAGVGASKNIVTDLTASLKELSVIAATPQALQEANVLTGLRKGLEREAEGIEATIGRVEARLNKRTAEIDTLQRSARGTRAQVGQQLPQNVLSSAKIPDNTGNRFQNASYLADISPSPYAAAAMFDISPDVVTRAQRQVAGYRKIEATIAEKQVAIDKINARLATLRASLAGVNQSISGVDQQDAEFIGRNAAFVEATTGKKVEMFSDEAGTQPIGGGEKRVDAAFYQSLNLSASATKNFQAQLEKLGLTGSKVKDNWKDLNSGFRNLRFEAEQDGAISKYTAVLDNAGNIVNNTQNKFRSFASGLARDVVEVLKWSIAIGAIYGPMRKLNELIEESKKIQADLIDVQISLGGSTTNLQNVFEASISIANETSSAVEGVIEGYTAAVAAAGGAANEAQRLATTEVLVRDSMVLAKLASIGQKEALDTLVGGLRQANLELTDGMQLLDSWVAVSRNANVSINQLATTFAIVGAASEEVGLSYSELNGLAAVMAETTKLSADEVGNAIRGIIATLQSDTASQEFAKYGIATKTLTGDLRNMMDILKELSMLGSTGVLDEKAMGALTQAGGGGARRGAQLSALVQNMSRVMDVIAVSEGASGDAATALELKMTTLESASQRLNNAFSALAQSMGMEGGIVDGLTLATNAFAGIINGVKELVSILKWATPILAMSGIGKLLMGSQTGARMLGAQLPMGIASLFTPSFGAQKQSNNWLGTAQNLIQGRDPLKNAPLTNAILRRLQGTGMGYTTTEQGVSTTNTVGGFLGSMFGWAGKGWGQGRFKNMTAMNMMVPAMMMGSTLMSKDEDKWSRLGAQAGGTGIGVGLTALTGNAMWPMIGSIIATGFYEKFLTFEADIAKDWISERERILDERANAPNTPQGEAAPEPRTAEEIEAELKGSLGAWETFRANFREDFLNAGVFVYGMWSDLFNRGTELGIENQADVTQSTALLSLSLSGALDAETQALVGELFNAALLEEVTGSLENTSIGAIRTSNIEAVTSIAATASEDLMSKALEEIAKGASGSIQNYLDYSQAATQYATTAGSLMTAQQQAGMDVMEPSEAVSFVTQLTPDEAEGLATTTTQIISSTAAIETLQDQIAQGYATGASDSQMRALEKSLAAYTEQLEAAKAVLPGFQQALQTSVLTRSAESKLLDLVEVPEGLTSEQRAEIIARAEEMWREVLELSGITEEEINAYIEAQRDQIIRANNEIYPELTKVPQNFISGAAEEQGYTGASSNWGFMDLRENYNQESFMSQLMPRYTQLVSAFKKNFGDLYKPDISEDYGFVLQDGFTTMDVDLKLLNLALQDLVDLTREKGLEGIYNLPAGATFMIPADAFMLDRQTRAGMGGGSSSSWEDIIAPSASYGGERGKGKFPYRTGVGPTDEEEQLSTTTPDEIRAEVERFRAAGEARQWAAFAEYREAGPTRSGAFEGSPYAHDQEIWDEKYIKGQTTELSPILDALSNLFRGIPRTSWEQFMPHTQTAPPSETSQTLTPAPVGINLSVDSNIQLVVDGRTLATIIKPFLYEDLIRFSSSSPSNINRSIVG